MLRKTPSTILVIIGITGDLAKRKLLPAIAQMQQAEALPQDFTIVGISRRQVSAAEVVISTPNLQDSDRAFLAECLHMHTMDIADEQSYAQLKAFLASLSTNSATQIVFYLSVPPQVSRPIIAALGRAGFGKDPQVKLLLEKPFGSDLTSAQELIAETRQYFNESQLYRIDHFLAKEMAQNIVVFRSQNSLFRQTWNNQHIESIEIIASEQIGIEDRAAFYEQTGALRDVIQNHLLQLAALTLMKIPSSTQDIAKQRLAALRQLLPPNGNQLDMLVHRGQYEGYTTEVNNTKTSTETFVDITLHSADPQWQGVPIRLITGKALATKETVVRLHYKRQQAGESNMLSLRIQPDEGIEMRLWAKKPGYQHRLEQLPLRFTYQEHYNSLPEAYERVLVDAINGDHSLFASSEEVLEAWRIVAPIQHYWSMQISDLAIYPKGMQAKQDA